MQPDLNNMSRSELETLKVSVDKALATLDERRRAEARAAAEKAARDHGFSLDEVLAAQRKSGKKSAPKYRNPNDPAQTWTGKGRQPGWIKEGLAAGKLMDDFLI